MPNNFKDISQQILDNAISFGYSCELPFPDFDPRFRGAHYKKEYLVKYFPDFYNFLLVTYPMVDEHKVRMQLIIHGLKEPPRCPTCGKYVKMNANGKFNSHCSKICGIHDLETKKKTRETCSKRTQEEREKIYEKKKKTCLENNGAENPMYLESSKKKMKETNLERYGGISVLSTETGKDNFRRVCFEHFGVENPMQSKEVREKSKKTLESNYGVDNPTKSKDIIEKRKRSNLEKYGTEDPGNLPENIEKRKRTSVERYGVDNPSKSPEIISKISETTMSRHGVMWPCQVIRNGDSVPESDFEKMLTETGFVIGKDYEKQFPLGGFKYDFKIGSTLVEIDPTPTHNSLFSPYAGGKPKNKTYHRDKSDAAKIAGYSCIHIWDWDNPEKIVGMLTGRENVGARQCDVTGFFSNDGSVKEFLDDNHLQGNCKGTKVSIGLTLDGDLIEVMTFGNPRYNKNYQWELLRLCTTKGYSVTGGAERLFKEFTRSYNPESVISYCDMSKFSGTVYERLGFRLKSKPFPSCHWYNTRTKQHITDNLLMSMGFDKLFGTEYGKGTSNEELIKKAGFLPVWDCGQATYIWKDSDD